MEYTLGVAAKVARAMNPTIMGEPRMRRGDYDIVPYQSTHNTGGTIMGTDPKTSVVNRYLQSWDRQSVHYGRFHVSAAAGLQPDRTGGSPCLLVGRGDRHQVSQEPRSTGTRMIAVTGRIMRHSLSGVMTGVFLLLALTPSTAAAADSDHGKVLYQTCAACHTERPDALGPSLKGVVGRKSAALEDFRYSNPMKRANLVWDENNLREYVQDPQAKVKGNRMPYGGLTDGKDVDDIIAYLKTLQ